MKTRIHINLSVSDIERSSKFYAQLFGAKATKVRDDYANFRLDEPRLHLALVKAPEHAQGDSEARHFGVELFDNAEFNDWRDRLENTGAALKVEEQVTCCYAVSDKFWAQDPDGNDWEFWVRTSEADAMNEDSNAACCTPEQAEKAVASAEKNDEAPCCAPSNAGQTGCC